jgi:hypothetical protein
VQGLQVLESGSGDLGARQVEVLQILEPGQFLESDIGDLEVAQQQCLKVFEVAQFLQPVVGDLRGVEPQESKVLESSDFSEARIGNGTAAHYQLPEVFEFFDLLENRVGRVPIWEDQSHNGLPRRARLIPLDFAARLDDRRNGLPFDVGPRTRRLGRDHCGSRDLLALFRDRLRRRVTVAARNGKSEENAGE